LFVRYGSAGQFVSATRMHKDNATYRRPAV
jgi:hypothetical protein